MQEKLSNHELIELWLAAADEEAGRDAINDEQRATLNRLIEEDVETRQRLVALSQQLAWLMWNGSAKSESIDVNNADAVVARINGLIESTESTETDETARRARLFAFLGEMADHSGMLFRPPLVFFTLLAAVFVGAFFAYRISQSGAQPMVAQSPPRDQRGILFADAESQAVPAAYLTMMNGCSWGANPPKTQSVGNAVNFGDEIALQEGIAEFRLSSGVLLNVEGPAALVLTSPTSLMLQYGKLTARVPWEVKDFRLLAGTCRVFATESEFGVYVSDRGVEVHSFLGNVTVTPSPFGRYMVSTADVESDFSFEGLADFDSVVVGDGEAISYSYVGENRDSAAPRQGEADRSKFATKLSMAGGLPVTEQYIDTVLESRPVAYWRFETIKGESVPNEIDGRHPLAVVGEVSLAGDVANYVAELGRPQTAGHFEMREPLTAMSGTSSYSVEMWIKPSHFHRGVLLGMIVASDDPKIEQPEKHGFLLELERGYESRVHPPGSLRFLHRNPPGIRLGTSCYSNRLYGLRHWQHVVAVKEKSAMRLYIDGKVVAAAADKTALAKDMKFVIGQTYSSQSVFPYVGQLDELAIYNRALVESEVKKHCDAVQLDRRESPDS